MGMGMSTITPKLIETCAKCRVKSLKIQAENVEVEFYPESGDQIAPTYAGPIEIDPTPAPVPEHIQKEIAELEKEDEIAMQIIEDPSGFEERLINQMMGGEDDEE